MQRGDVYFMEIYKLHDRMERTKRENMEIPWNFQRSAWKTKRKVVY